MRIVGGRHRGRAIAAPPGRAIRPTSDRVRESVFNILGHGRAASPIAGARVLDGFAGTGAMGLEALSRGADHASFMDTDIAPCRANVAALGEAARARLIEGDCTRPGPPPEAHDLVFLDPPYGSGLAAPALGALAGAGWIAERAVCVLELAAGEAFEPPGGFSLVDSRKYGAARIEILRLDGGASG